MDTSDIRVEIPGKLSFLMLEKDSEDHLEGSSEK
jgi:hypothetical protein